MKNIRIYKAAPIYKGKETESVTITIESTFPERDVLSDVNEIANRDAVYLEKVLIDSLPGATYDRLLGHMLARKSTHFRVSHGGKSC
ncbi:MAG: hypothetical protein LLG42_11925 [Chloroflexi bacterium]|nr:hypothetical protein [Chloroflexota bacterium]